MAITQEQLNMILGMNPPPPNSIRADLQKGLAIMFQGGAPIRNAIGSALTGDFSPAISGFRNVGKEISELSNMKMPTSNNADMRNIDISKAFTDVTNYAPMGMAGTFIGKGSNLWDAIKAKEAIKLEKAGVAPQEIWSKTGTLRGVDGKLRQEISDVDAKITDNVYEGIVKNKRFEGKMGEALTHPLLYKSYPDTADIGTGMYAWKTPEGNYEDFSRTISVGGPSTSSQKSAALHEIQHDIQRKEGFAVGGTPTSVIGSGLNKDNQFDFAKQAYEDSIGKSGQMSDDQLLAELFDKPFIQKNNKNWEDLTQREKLNWLDAGRQRAYRRLAGEAEARLTQRRMKLTPEERLQYFPYNQGQEVYGLDVPYNELIIKGLID